MSIQPARPPMTETAGGDTRRVGVEVEFAGVDVQSAADLVAACFGGPIEEDNPYRFNVEGTDAGWGPFTVELDTKYVHPDDGGEGPSDGPEGEWAEKGREIVEEVASWTREAIGETVSGVVPTEIVCPPVPWPDLGALDALFDGLRQRGAEGTDASPAYAFGLHLNPEVADETADYIVRHLRAFFHLVESLRDEIDVDLTRRILPHSDPFPDAYRRRVLDHAYAPDLATLIDDYLADNPTRNRDLDLLPLFAHLDEARVRAVMDDDRIKPRPTFHYRLPNSRVDKAGWTAVTEWNRWVRVEERAAAGNSGG